MQRNQNKEWSFLCWDKNTVFSYKLELTFSDKDQTQLLVQTLPQLSNTEIRALVIMTEIFQKAGDMDLQKTKPNHRGKGGKTNQIKMFLTNYQ